MNGILGEVAFNFIPLVHKTFPKPYFWLLTSPSLLYTAVMLCHCRSQIKEPLRMNEWLLTQACFQREVAAAVLLYDCPVSKLGDLIVPSRHLLIRTRPSFVEVFVFIIIFTVRVTYDFLFSFCLTVVIKMIGQPKLI